MNEATDQYTEPPEQLLRQMQATVTLKLTCAQTILDTLHHLDHFLRRHASPAVRAELAAYCTTQGWSPASGTHALLDGIGLHALALHWAIQSTTDHTHDTAHAGGTAKTARDKETT